MDLETRLEFRRERGAHKLRNSGMGKLRWFALLIASAVFVNLCSQTVIEAASFGKKQKQMIKQTTTAFITEEENVQEEEYRAYWFSFYDYDTYREKYKKRTAKNFKEYFTGVVKKGKSLGMNHIIVQVRPFGDAVYESKYFPWSKYISGEQGKNPGFDPLKIMVSAAHESGIKIEAWINPYRVTKDSTNYRELSQNNPARKWHEKRSTSRNVLSYGGSLYYNPAKGDVRNLIINGAKEIVQNYDVDGIHMDDYFYPSFTEKNVETAFDAKEYRQSSYKKEKKSINTYRRAQVNTLVSQMKAAIKKIDPKVTYGISPAGNIDNLTSKYSYYVDIYKWLNSTKYVDYICPQIYWGFQHPTESFDKVTDRWVKAAKNKKVKLYIGVAVYRAGHNIGQNQAEQKEWKNDIEVLKKQVQYGRKTGVDGFSFFDYQDFNSKISEKAVEKLKTVLK